MPVFNRTATYLSMHLNAARSMRLTAAISIFIMHVQFMFVI